MNIRNTKKLLSYNNKNRSFFCVERVRDQIGYERAFKQRLTGNGIGIGVLDSGVFLHEDLKDRVKGFKDFLYQRNRPYDDLGHGTHVCGIIAGSGRMSKGKYQGIASGCNLYVGKVLDKYGNGELSILLEGLEWLLDNKDKFNLRLINVSVGTKQERKNSGLEDMQEIEEKERRIMEISDKISESGIILVTAAGNFGPAPRSISLLGQSPKTIAVGCHDGEFRVNGKKMCEEYSGRGPSSFGIKKPDIVAPGTEIISCSRGRGYMAKSGTSMAAPIVTGALALAMEKYFNMNNDILKRRLFYSAKDLGESYTKQGWGMVDLKKLL